MLKALNKDGIPVNVLAWAIARNGWEYYVTEMPDEDGIGFAYVQGFEDEFGTFSIQELKPHLIMFKVVEDLSNDPESDAYLAPPLGGRWLTEEEIAKAEAEESAEA